MKLKILAFVAFAAMSVIGPANADEDAFLAGEKLLSLCEGDTNADKNLCSLYLAGIVDAHNALYAWGVVTQKYFCNPDTLTYRQLRKIFIKFANNNPQRLHLDAASMVINPLHIAFPCE